MKVFPATLLILIGWTATFARAEISPVPVSLNGDDLGPFLDQVVPEELAKRLIAGAVVVVVSDGKVLFRHGYGYADVANKIPMDADATVVRPGSISKLFTAIAVMQLVEQGKLDLDRDVNGYLDFHVPTPAGGVPVTARLLLSHRAGFENHLKNLFLPGTASPPLRGWLVKALPPRLFPHGDVPAYSNYGYALAGYLVERVSGEKFEDYVAQHILNPLRLAQSTFAEPVSAALATHLSHGYFKSTGPALPYFEVIAPTSAGGMSTTGADMGQFMLDLLDAEHLQAAGVLKAESLKEMMTPSSAGEGVIDQPLLGFEEEYAAGNVMIGKHGLTSTFVTELALLPRMQFGIFVSYNSATAFALPTELVRTVTARYFREGRGQTASLSQQAADAKEVSGAYQSSQREDSSFFRLPELLHQLVVSVTPEGKLNIFGEGLRETAPMHFEGAPDMQIQFKKRKEGYTLRGSVVPLAMEWQRVPKYLDARLVLPLVGAAVATIVSTLVLWPVAAFMRRRQGRRFAQNPNDERDFVWVRVVLGIDALAFIGILGLFSIADDVTHFNDALDPLLLAMYFCAWLGSLGSLYVVWVAARFLREGIGSPWARIHHTLLAVATIVLAWFFLTWRIAGTTLNF